MSLGTSSRIKKCICGKEFEDHTTNLTRVWCSDSCRCKYNRSSLTKNKKEGEMKKELVDVQEFSKQLLTDFASQKKLIRLPQNKNLFKGKIVESAVLMISDIHCGQINKFPDKNGVMVDTYNNEIMLQEFDRLLDSVYGINHLLSASYDIKKLYVFGLGDYLENDVIFHGQRFFIDKGVGAQLMTLVKVFSDFLTECLKMYDEVEFICVIGNHGRFQIGREAAPTSNSFDYLFGQMLKIAFRDNPRVKIVVPETWWHMQEIYGWKYFLHHGDIIYSWMGIPFYGLKKQGTQRRVEMPFDIECIGHFHTRMELPIGRDSISLVNGAWIDKSDHGWRRFGNLSKPEQYFFGVSKKRARSWGFSLDLLHSKQEWKEAQK